MRTSILSRSVIAVASLAVGSVALAAVPATAASASGITREMVLTAVTNLRVAQAEEIEYPPSVERNVARMIERACNFDLDGWNTAHGWSAEPVEAGNVDGILLTTELHEVLDEEDEENYTHRQCTFAVLTTTDPAFSLSGSGSLSLTAQPHDEEAEEPLPVVTKTAASALSGDVFVTSPISLDESSYLTGASFSATGNATRTFTVGTSEQVLTPKSPQAKKAAKKKYDKALKAAKKAYNKALKKAGDNKAKKKAAKKAYNKKKAAAKKAYAKAIAPVKSVRPPAQQTENRPFSVSANVTSSPR